MKLLHVVQMAAHGGIGDFIDAVLRANPGQRTSVLLVAVVVIGGTRLLLRLRRSGHGDALDEAIWFYAGHMPLFRTLLNAVTSIVIVGTGASLVPGAESLP